MQLEIVRIQHRNLAVRFVLAQPLILFFVMFQMLLAQVNFSLKSFDKRK
mgnify:CR=1 FL=1